MTSPVLDCAATTRSSTPPPTRWLDDAEAARARARGSCWRRGPCCLQLRAKEAGARGAARPRRALLLPLCRAAGVPFCVNDRLDVALAVGADVVHLGQDDLPLADALARARGRGPARAGDRLLDPQPRPGRWRPRPAAPTTSASGRCSAPQQAQPRSRRSAWAAGRGLPRRRGPRGGHRRHRARDGRASVAAAGRRAAAVIAAVDRRARSDRRRPGRRRRLRAPPESSRSGRSLSWCRTTWGAWRSILSSPLASAARGDFG